MNNKTNKTDINNNKFSKSNRYNKGDNVNKYKDKMNMKSKTKNKTKKNKSNKMDKLFEKEHKECLNARGIKESSYNSLKPNNNNRKSMTEFIENYIETHHYSELNFVDFVMFMISGLFLDSIIILKACLYYMGKIIMVCGGAWLAINYINMLLDKFIP